MSTEEWTKGDERQLQYDLAWVAAYEATLAGRASYDEFVKKHFFDDDCTNADVHDTYLWHKARVEKLSAIKARCS